MSEREANESNFSEFAVSRFLFHFNALTIRDSRFVIRDSKFEIGHSSLVIHSSFVIRASSFTSLLTLHSALCALPPLEAKVEPREQTVFCVGPRHWTH